jgi:hypothetical protein
MEDEAVRRRNWVTREQFLDLLGAANLIPGPTSTEMTMHLGYRRAGWPGLIVAGTCFIVPATVLVTALAWAYVRFGTLPQAAAVLYGVKPVVIAVVAQAMWNLARTAVKSRWLGLLGAAAAACALTILASAGTVAEFRGWRNSLRKKAVSTANDRLFRLSHNAISIDYAASGTGLLACQSLFGKLFSRAEAGEAMLCQGMASRLRRIGGNRALYQGTASAVPEQVLRVMDNEELRRMGGNRALYQGTASAVPKTAIKNHGALAPAAFMFAR